MAVVSPFQGLVLVILLTQGDAARLTPLRSAPGWFVVALSGLGFCECAYPWRSGASGMASLADRRAFIIPSSAGQVIQVGASRRDVLRADAAKWRVNREE